MLLTSSGRACFNISLKEVLQQLSRHYCRSKCISRTTTRILTLNSRFFCDVSSANNGEPHVHKWKQPVGYETSVKIYNHILRKNVPLVIRHDKLLTWYICGPTVYSETHIGHACTYVRFDIIRRILIKFFSIDIVMCMGVTDIDDKIIAKSRELNMDYKTLTRKYESDFFRQMSLLKILPPTVTSRVTEHIPEVITLVDGILKNGCAYVTEEGSVYFDVEKYGKYGKLAVHDVQNDYTEITDKLKRNRRDFALWKAAKPGEPWWNSPWGKGRPGWHIECSAMASSILGETIDIHSGGIDLLFPHHENEEAQCGAFLGTDQWVNYWMHAGHLYLKGDESKMSKSLKNTVSLQEFLENYTPNHFRIMCLRSNYKLKIDYSESVMLQSVAINKKLESFLSTAEAYIDGHLECDAVDESNLMECLAQTKVKVEAAVANDFDTSGALKEILKLTMTANKIFQSKSATGTKATRSSGVIAACYAYIERVLGIMGLKYPGRKTVLMSSEMSSPHLPQVLDSVVKFRSKVRAHALKTGKDSQAKMQNKLSSEDVDDVDIESQDTLLPELPQDPPLDKGDIMWTTKRSSQPKVTKVTRKQQDPILQACDELRNELIFSGIQIKDHSKDLASWAIHEDPTILSVRTSLTDQDPYEPNYNPKSPRIETKKENPDK